MIEDIEGATSEPRRRRQVVALSAVGAAVSLILLVALVLAPPSRVGTGPQAASPAPSASPGFVMNIAPNPISRLRLDLTRDSVCPDGTRLIPPYYLAVDASTGAIFAVRSDGRWTRSVPVIVVPDTRTSWLTVTCATSDIVSPWESDAR